jgi:hypothetical protein
VRDWAEQLADVRGKLGGPKLRDGEVMLDTQGTRAFEEMQREQDPDRRGPRARETGPVMDSGPVSSETETD